MSKPFNLEIYSVGGNVVYHHRNAYHDINNWNEGYTDVCRTGVISHISPNDVEIECAGESSVRKVYLTSNDISTGFYKIELTKE